MSALELFDPFRTPLHTGVNVCDASAGTGKTYAIAMLVLRFVVEQGVDIKQILVVTFTKAATEELKDRIRARLQEAKMALAQQHASDQRLLDWLNGLTLPAAEIHRRLALALLDIDCAGIFTIHGFCQRALQEYALESGQLFDVTLTAEVAALRQVCADDYWRITLYPRSPWEAALLTMTYHTPAELLDSLPIMGKHLPVFPAQLDLVDLLAQLPPLCQQALEQLEGAVASLTPLLADDYFKSDYTQSFTASVTELRAWLAGDTIELSNVAILSCLTRTTIASAINRNKFKPTKTQTTEERLQAFWQTHTLTLDAFDALSALTQQLHLQLRLGLLHYLRQHFDQQLQQLNALSFDDLISRLADVLQSAQGGLLQQELQRRYRVALIDEFQDTDQQQWGLFAALFAQAAEQAEPSFLYLIGDPKQAIYKFRGADIYSYFAAQQQAQHQFTLGSNWRSHPHLVEAVNAFFQRPLPFLVEQVSFYAVKPGREVQDGFISQAGAVLAPMQLWQLPRSETKDGYWTSGKAASQISQAVINEIVQLLTTDTCLIKGAQQIKVQPQDIAILLRTNLQAREYQQALRAAGVPAVLNSTESVFLSPEAQDLYRLLAALSNPADISLAKQALSMSWFGLDGQQFYVHSQDELRMDAWVFRLQTYNQQWQSKGLLAMMRELLHQEQVYQHLAQTPFAERTLTNLNHLLELLQQAILDEHLGLAKTLEWLHAAMIAAQKGLAGSEEQQLRLENDANAVKLVTMHRSKGLEYGIVFCPCLWQRNNRLLTETEALLCHDQGQMVADLGSAQFNQRKQQALTEELAEDIRVLYVALTRAKYRCYVIWADVRSKEKANESALAYLLDLGAGDFCAQQAQLQSLVTQAPHAFHYTLLPSDNSVTESYQAESNAQTLSARTRRRKLYTHWQMSSYTALSALSIQDVPELPQDKADEPTTPMLAEELDPLPRGEAFGNVVHSLLENISFGRWLPSEHFAHLRERTCQRYGIQLSNPALLDALLLQTLNTPLAIDDPDFCLKNLPDNACNKEMPFYFAMQHLDTSAINQLLQTCPVFQPLDAQQMSGYLTGFIDLVCSYQQRYYVLDYKTNYLPDYQPAQLATAMREHNYGLQYWLYSLVLHRYLQQRLPDYDYQRHFGGVRYLFVRGMQAEQAMSGVYQDRPDEEHLNALGDILLKHEHSHADR